MEAGEHDGMDDDDGSASAFASAVRREVLTPIDGDDGVFRARLPWDLVLLLAGAPLAASSLEAALSGDYFVELGERVVRFLTQFDAERGRARKGRKRYTPDRKTLENRFGENWELVQELWPAVRWLEPVRRIVAVSSGPDMTLLDGLRPWKEEALLFLVTRAPHQLEYATVRRELEYAAIRLAGAKRRKLYPTEVEALVGMAMEPSRALERALTYTPSGNAALAYDHWIGCARNRLRDLASQPVILGRGPDGKERRRARGTLRRLKSEGRLEVDENGKLKKPLIDIVLEAEAARSHRDPTGGTRNAAQVAELLGRSQRSVIAAIHKAFAPPGDMPEPPRLRGGPGYALTDEHIAVIEHYLGPKRGPKGERTVRVVARELAVAPNEVLRVIREYLLELQTQGRQKKLKGVLRSMGGGAAVEAQPEFSIVSDALLKVVKRRLAT